MSKNRIYYGEYTLRHWIDLLLSGNIVLPKYQRSFVWDKTKVLRFFESINEDLFIPPITIGYDTKASTNIIIDGQQRLTSLLLGCLEIFPKKEKFKTMDMFLFVDENDDVGDDNDNLPLLGWTLKELINGKNDTLDSIKANNPVGKDCNYESLTIGISLNNDFLEKHYLGFSYLVPEDSTANYFFANTFKNINTAGTALTPLESRRSMYYLSDGAEKFFDPKCCSGILIDNGNKAERIDFVRYLSFAFQYKVAKNYELLGKNYGGKRREEYYADFILSVITGKLDSKFAQFDEKNKKQINTLKNCLYKLDIINKHFSSIIDADIYLFGLVYYNVVETKNIDLKQKDRLLELLDRKIDELKKDEKHKKSPASFKYLRKRIKESMEIYKGFVV